MPTIHFKHQGTRVKSLLYECVGVTNDISKVCHARAFNE